MPKLGMEPIRRKSLIEAAIAAIHDRGSLDVTIGDIARRAGVSHGLTHHYFGSKDHLIVAAMRHLLSEYGRAVRARLRGAGTPRDRVTAIIHASLAPSQFRPEIVSAWLAFYTYAQTSEDAKRLLDIYARRLRSNLAHALRPLAGEEAMTIAEGVAALIDGIYIRGALAPEGRMQIDKRELVDSYVTAMVGGRTPSPSRG